ncbi:hypothetical protein B296_00042416 [Ensete ventricosum]|uniref:Uncharacterized protein n=1 Tax=Ensete ventricosum TaxID=4639 RepID=A0A426Y889_ENSVE|nr:hypothetical protein B296_00042416 [Ensete ventricosum]
MGVGFHGFGFLDEGSIPFVGFDKWLDRSQEQDQETIGNGIRSNPIHPLISVFRRFIDLCSHEPGLPPTSCSSGTNSSLACTTQVSPADPRPSASGGSDLRWILRQSPTSSLPPAFVGFDGKGSVSVCVNPVLARS